MPLTATEVTMAKRPQGALQDDDFAFVERALAEPAEGEVVVENHWMSLDPYMRLYLTEQSGAHAPLQIGETLHGGAVGQVVQSNAESLPVGSFVQSMLGFRDRFVASAAELQPIDASLAPVQAYLGVLGLTGPDRLWRCDAFAEAAAGRGVLCLGRRRCRRQPGGSARQARRRTRDR